MRLCHQCGSSSNDQDRFCRSCGGTLLEEQGAVADALIGRTIGGYIVQTLIGVGGMGRVYRAEQTALGRSVAIKVIHPHLLSDDAIVARFYTEARATSCLNHPNSVSIIDFGRTDDGILYLAMEFLSGKDLAEIIHEEGPIPFRRTCEIVAAVLSALEEAHFHDVVHRDLKPENIILRRLGSGSDLIKVVDFGLATIVGGNKDTSITRPDLVCGTPDYMPPEQARGESVDGRADLYSLGVMLYELLADELPFEDDTPTKVVLRHINDPVPDPRKAAPHRGIPDPLAEVAVRALQKKPDDRFQSAKEMAAALANAFELIDAKPKKIVKCSACGAPNPKQMQFCGKCGSRLNVRSAIPTPPPLRLSFPPITARDRPLIGRAEVLDTIKQCRMDAEGFTSINVSGPTGVGKTRILREAADIFAEAGDVVAGAVAHPLAVPIPYYTVRQMITSLCGVAETELLQLVENPIFQAPFVKAGLEELITPVGLVGQRHQSRVEAVTAALRAAVRQALGGQEAGARVAFLIDDFDGCDGLSELVFAELDETDVQLLLFTTSQGPMAASTLLALRGLCPLQAERFLAREADVANQPVIECDPDDITYLPLYLEQLHPFGVRSLADKTLPQRLAEAVAQRVDRLGMPARRLLQALSVLGGRASLDDDLAQIAGLANLAAANELGEAGLAQIQGRELVVEHFFIARVVAAFIPVEARRRLHRDVEVLIAKRGGPIEEIAEHAYQGGYGMRTLMTLEKMGDACATIGAHKASVLAFQRALELARRELVESGDAVMDTAVVSFSRKLGEALGRTGALVHADGVVREAMELTGPYSVARARMYLSLGRTAIARNRSRDAMRLMAQALEIVDDDSPALGCELQLSLADLRLSNDDVKGALSAFRRALDLNNEPTIETRTLYRLAETSIKSGDWDAAHESAVDGMSKAGDIGHPVLVAWGHGLLGQIAQANQDLIEAGERFRAARMYALQSGDGVGARRWQEELERSPIP